MVTELHTGALETICTWFKQYLFQISLHTYHTDYNMKHIKGLENKLYSL